MVKVGFICEGLSDRIIIESSDFGRILNDCGIELTNVISVGGVQFLSNEKRESHREILLSQGASCVIVIRDKDNVECFTNVKELYQINQKEHFVIAQKELESWFLADHNVLSKCLGLEDLYFEFPENQTKPFEYIKSYRGRGMKSKNAFAEKMVLLGFSLENAANHPNCHSAKYFIKKLKEIGQQS